MKTVVIAGGLAHRYDHKTRIESAELDQDGCTKKEFMSNLEHFRQNGLPPEIIDPPIAPRDPEVIVREVFDLIVETLPRVLMQREIDE